MRDFRYILQLYKQDIVSYFGQFIVTWSNEINKTFISKDLKLLSDFCFYVVIIRMALF